MTEAMTRGDRFRRFWRRHRTLLWTLHSLWALATGVFVVWLSRERYSFVPWVVLFLALTWASTLYFGRKLTDTPDAEDGAPRLGDEVTSYLTRTMYQETLFFLLPFYAYSTVLGSPNTVFLVGLGALAFVSCIDLVFDRWLRTSPVASVVFFSVVAFTALNLLIPILLPVEPTASTRIAALAAVLSAAPLVHGSVEWTRATRLRVGGTALLFLAVVLGAPQLVPPVPLRLESAVFSADIERESLEPLDTLSSGADLDELDGAIVIVLEVFAPTVVSTGVSVVWDLDGEVIRQSREVDILAHELGFRLWDAWRPTDSPLRPGRYRVTVRTASGSAFGRAAIDIAER